MFRLNKLASLQIFQLIRYAAFVLIGIGFAKLYLSQTEIGQFETFTLISGMVSFFWVSGIINTMLATYANKTDEVKRVILTSTFVSLSVCSLIAGGCLYLFSQTLFDFLHKQGDQHIVTLAIIYLLLSGPSFITEYVLFLNDKSKAVITYGIISAALTVLLALTPVLLHYPIEYAMWGLIITAGCKLIFAVFVLQKYATLKPDGRILLQTMATNLKQSAPLIASVFVSGSAEYIDGIIVKSQFDDPSLALFRYGAKELPVLLIIANTFSTAMIPAIAANLDEGLKELKERSRKMMHVFFPLTIVLMPLSPFLFMHVFNPSFLYSAFIFNIYLLLAIPRLLFPQTILMGRQKNSFLLLSSVLEIVINVSLSIYLAGKMGLPGIALGTFIAYTFDKIFLVCVNRFYFNIPVQKYVPLIPYFVYIILTFVSFFCSIQVLKNV